MARVLQFQRSLRSLSKPHPQPQFQAPIVYLIPSLVGDHGRYSTRVSNILEGRAAVSTNKNSPYGFRTVWSGRGTFGNWACLSALLGAGIIGIARGWLHCQSELCNAPNSCPILTEEEANALIPGNLVGWNTVTITIWTKAVDGLTEEDFKLALKFNKLDAAEHLLSRTDRILDLLKRKAATISP